MKENEAAAAKVAPNVEMAAKRRRMEDTAQSRRRIAVSREERRKLMTMFGVGERTVFYALNGNGDKSELTARIRKAAMERGGTVLVTLPEMETFHDADGVMRQLLPNGAQLEFSKSEGWCEVYYEGSLIGRYQDVKVSEIESIQQFAQKLTGQPAIAVN